MSKAKAILSLLEAIKYKVMVCDVQPGYLNSIHFSISELMDFLNESSKVLVFYVGSDFGYENDKDILNWYYDNGLDESVDITFVEKNYAFFRSWMDLGADDNLIIKVVKYMAKKRIYDSRDLKQSEIDKLIGDDWEDWMDGDPLGIPNIDLNVVKKFSGAKLVGGAENECLAELRLYLDAFNIKYKLVHKFAY